MSFTAPSAVCFASPSLISPARNLGFQIKVGESEKEHEVEEEEEESHRDALESLEAQLSNKATSLWSFLVSSEF
ncbi:hypothetical protein U1Q18_004164 [Sarracenia purpurea var. burkii]